MTAVKILWAGIKQLFWMGVKETIRAVQILPGKIWAIMKRIGTQTVATLWNLFSSIPSLLLRALKGESLGDAMGAILSTGDWLDGLATERILEASGEIKQLTSEVQRFNEAKAIADQQNSEL
ncbi:unnamed protein product, partial [Hapterophycus canaliculatus]